MTNQERALTPAAIKYLLTISELCRSENGARCVDIATKLKVSKPSAHSMIRNLCDAGLASKERYRIVYLTEKGRAAAALYETCYEPLCERMKGLLGLDDEAIRNVACAVMAQVSDQLPELARKLA